MPQDKVLLVYKESAYTSYLSSRTLMGKLKSHSYWKVVMGSHRRHHLSLEGVREALAREGLGVDMVLRARVQRLKNLGGKYRMVLSVGGDGTLLDASHFVRETPILGVNSDPVRSVARFSGCDLRTFPGVLRAFLGGRLRPVPVPRLEFSVNGRKNPCPVLNEILVSTLSPAGTSRYVLRVGNRAEEQMSSGVWVSTAAGSTAAILSAGGKALPVSSPKFQYVVREIFSKKFGPRKLLKGVLGHGRRMEIVSYMKEGRIFIDGANIWEPFRLGDRLRVGTSPYPLRIIGLRH